MLQDLEFDYPVVIPWSRWGTMQNLAEIVAQITALFGRPGDRYQYNMTNGGVTCIFCNPQDALLFKLKFLEYL
jgi:hypothetical protein